MKKNKLFTGLIFMALLFLGLVSCDQPANTTDPQSDPQQAVLTGLSVTKGPTKTDYWVGEKLDTTGLEITAKYSDNSTKVITDYTCSGFDSSFPVSNLRVTVKCKESEFVDTYFVVNIKLNSLVSIAVTKPASKLNYKLNESFDSTGLEISGTYEDGTTKVLPASSYSIWGFNPFEENENLQLKVITYDNGKEISTTFTVTVTNLEQVAEPVITCEKEYLEATDKIYITCATEGASIYYTFNSSVWPTKESSLYTDEGIILPKGYGSETITVVAMKDGMAKSEYVRKEFIRNDLVKLKLNIENAVKKYAINSEFDKSGIIATAVYRDDSTKNVADLVVYSGFDSSETTTSQKITVKYTENNYSVFAYFDIEIYCHLESIEITEAPTVLFYEDEVKDVDFVVKATYSDGSKKQIYNFKVKFDSTIVGKQNAVVTYTEGEITKTAEVEIIIRELESISAELARSVWYVGQTISRNAVTVTANYTDGTTRTVTGFNISAGTLAEEDITDAKTVTITYKEGQITKTAEVTIKVRSNDYTVAPVLISDNRYYFGEYPQTIKSDSVTITDETDSRGYYKGSDGNWYAKITATPRNAITKYSNGQSVVSEEVYFKVEPIEWTVLTSNFNSTGNALLFAVKALDSGIPFCTTSLTDGLRKIKGKTVYPNNYEHSTVRAFLNGLSYYDKKYQEDELIENDKYLNNGFLQTAFSSTAINIETTSVTNGEGTTKYTLNGATIVADGKYRCGTLSDKVFLLSVQNVTSFGLGNYVLYGRNSASQPKRIRHSTDYAKARGAFDVDTNISIGARWILRSPDNSDSGIQAIEVDGCNKIVLSNADGFDTVVPAITVKID